MIRDSKISMLIEEYQSGTLRNDKLLAFEHTLLNDESLQEELKLMQEIGAALTETDVHHLREKLQENSRIFQRTNHPATQFDLAENTLPDKICEQRLFETEITGDFEPLPRIHINNHHRNGKEKIHPLYKETLSVNESSDFGEDFSDDTLWPDLGEALTEKDIMSLRDSLGQIRRVTLTHNVSMEEVEDYIYGNMSVEEAESFEMEMEDNPDIAREVDLAVGLEAALAEKDIMALRDGLRLVMEKETSTPFSMHDLDDFLNGETDPEITAFIAGEMEDNADVRAELSLLREVNRAVGEHDIQELRSKLKAVKEDLPVRTEKSLLPAKNLHAGTKRLGIVAAFLVILLGFSVLVKYSVYTSPVSADFLGETPVALTSFRSAAPQVNAVLFEGFGKYNAGDFMGALSSFRQVIAVDNHNPAAWFYSGAALQSQKDYNGAIQAYEKVIGHRDNIFAEQAEWYLGLCYINSGQPGKARPVLEAIVTREGFYEDKAATLLRKLRKKG